MSNVIQLNRYRREQHKAWWNKNKHRIDEIIREKFEGQWSMDFCHLLHTCQPDQSLALPSWDYLDMRDIIFEAIHDDGVIDEIMSVIQSQRWYEARWISRDRVVERCLSLYVLSGPTVADSTS